MNKYTARWLADNYLTEAAIKEGVDNFAARVALSNQPKFIAIIGADELELFAPILAKYRFHCEPYPILNQLQITITK
jgi:hypothetical protein